MPTPLHILLAPHRFTVSMYLVLIGREALFPARKLPAIHFWRTKRIAAFSLSFTCQLTYRLQGCEHF